MTVETQEDIYALQALTSATFQTPDGTRLAMTKEARRLFNNATDELLELRGSRKEQG